MWRKEAERQSQRATQPRLLVGQTRNECFEALGALDFQGRQGVELGVVRRGEIVSAEAQPGPAPLAFRCGLDGHLLLHAQPLEEAEVGLARTRQGFLDGGKVFRHRRKERIRAGRDLFFARRTGEEGIRMLRKSRSPGAVAIGSAPLEAREKSRDRRRRDPRDVAAEQLSEVGFVDRGGNSHAKETNQSAGRRSPVDGGILYGANRMRPTQLLPVKVKSGPKGEEMGSREDDNKQLAQDMLDALSRADVAWVKEHYADDFRIWVGGSLPFSGENDKAGAVAAMPMVLDLFPEGLTFTAHSMIAGGDRVAIEATSSGKTFRGEQYSQEYCFLMRARDGKIVEWKEYMDTEHARQVLVGE